jgi:spore coat protein U-like protein
MRIGTSMVGVLLCASSAVPAAAQTFAVQAEIVEGCALVGSSEVNNLDFGVIDFGTLPAIFSGTAVASTVGAGGSATQIWCTPGVQLQVAVDSGLQASGGQRFLARTGGGSTPIPYGLYTDALQTVAIPTTGHVTVSVPPGGFLDLPIHGVASLPGGGLMPGQYTDVLQVTLSW